MQITARAEAEKCFAVLVKALDDQNALKTRDEMLGFRRRLRLFAACPEEPYAMHLQDTVDRMPQYIEWLRAERERFGDEPWHKATQLLQILREMLVDFPLDKQGHRAIVGG